MFLALISDIFSTEKWRHQSTNIFIKEKKRYRHKELSSEGLSLNISDDTNCWSRVITPPFQSILDLNNILHDFIASRIYFDFSSLLSQNKLNLKFAGVINFVLKIIFRIRKLILFQWTLSIIMNPKTTSLHPTILIVWMMKMILLLNLAVKYF